MNCSVSVAKMLVWDAQYETQPHLYVVYHVSINEALETEPRFYNHFVWRGENATINN